MRPKGNWKTDGSATNNSGGTLEPKSRFGSVKFSGQNRERKDYLRKCSKINQENCSILEHISREVRNKPNCMFRASFILFVVHCINVFVLKNVVLRSKWRKKQAFKHICKIQKKKKYVMGKIGLKKTIYEATRKP